MKAKILILIFLNSILTIIIWASIWLLPLFIKNMNDWQESLISMFYSGIGVYIAIKFNIWFKKITKKINNKF